MKMLWKNHSKLSYSLWNDKNKISNFYMQKKIENSNNINIKGYIVLSNPNITWPYYEKENPIGISGLGPLSPIHNYIGLAYLIHSNADSNMKTSSISLHYQKGN